MHRSPEKKIASLCNDLILLKKISNEILKNASMQF